MERRIRLVALALSLLSVPALTPGRMLIQTAVAQTTDEEEDLTDEEVDAAGAEEEEDGEIRLRAPQMEPIAVDPEDDVAAEEEDLADEEAAEEEEVEEEPADDTLDEEDDQLPSPTSA